MKKKDKRKNEKLIKPDKCRRCTEEKTIHGNELPSEPATARATLTGRPILANPSVEAYAILAINQI